MVLKARRAHLPARTKRGRPPGTILETTKLKRAAQASFNMLASHSARRILQSQLYQALGSYYVIELIRDPKDPLIIWERKIVRDDKRIQDFLENGAFEYGHDFIIVEGRPGDFRAGDAILNRAWGKPKETLEVEGDVKFSMRALHLHAQKVVKGEVIDAPQDPAQLDAPGALDDALDVHDAAPAVADTAQDTPRDVSSAQQE